MIISAPFNDTQPIHLDAELYLARRPILDGKRRLAAQEFLFCDPAGKDADRIDKPAPDWVLANAEQYGLTCLISDVPVYLRVDAGTLASETLRGLPPAETVLMLALEAVRQSSVQERVQYWRSRGYRFALDLGQADVDLDQTATGWLSLVESVHFSMSGRSDSALRALCAKAHAANKTLVAGDVDTDAQFHQCLALDCMLFRGRFFLEPSPGIREISPSQLTIAKLVGLLATDASHAEIENSIKSDPVLSLNLLHLANTPAFSVRRVESLHQALLMLGRNQLQKWLQLMLFSSAAQRANAPPALPLLLLASGRARLMELVAQTLHPGSRSMADTAFTVGIMSLMDRLFGIPMLSLLEYMPVVEEVVAALQCREGHYGELLQLAELCEWQLEAPTNLAQLQSLLPHLHLSHHVLFELQREALAWSDQIARNLG